MNLPLDTVILWLLGVSVFVLIMFILIVALFSQNARLKKRVKHWQGIHSSADLENVYQRTVDRVEAQGEELRNLEAALHGLEAAVRTKVGTPRVKRYNAFSDTGSDLSFSVALVDDTQTGVVLSSIYGREESRTYGKPVVDGHSSYPLTEEEMDVLSAEHSKMSSRQKHHTSV